jgi:hypothetical protein
MQESKLADNCASFDRFYTGTQISPSMVKAEAFYSWMSLGHMLKDMLI